MATIELCASKINMMTLQLNGMKSTINDFKTENELMKTQSYLFDTGICNTDIMQAKMQTSIDAQEAELESLESLIAETEDFYDLVATTDENVAELIESQKDDFYEEYSYLKPDCEKSWGEKFWEGCQAVGEWCREHWKLLVVIVIVIAAVVIIILSGGTALGAAGPFLLMLAKGALIGAVVGGLSGGVANVLTGRGTFWEGFESGAFSGAISGILTGGIGSWAEGMIGGSLNVLQTALLNGGCDAFVSFIGDVGDKYIKGDDISWGRIGANALFNGVFSGLTTAGTEWLKSSARPSLDALQNFLKKSVKFNGINKGTGCWKFDWCKALNNFKTNPGSTLGYSNTWKYVGFNFVDDLWDEAITFPKDIISNEIQNLIGL